MMSFFYLFIFFNLIYNVLGEQNLTTMQLILLEKNKNVGPAFGAVMLMHVKSSLFFPALKTVGTLLLSTLYVSTNNKRQLCAYDSFF